MAPSKKIPTPRFNRRDLFKALAGGALISRLPQGASAQSCSGTGPAVLWNVSAGGPMQPSSAVFERGSIWYRINAGNINTTVSQQIRQVDVQTGSLQKILASVDIIPSVDQIYLPKNGSSQLLYGLSIQDGHYVGYMDPFKPLYFEPSRGRPLLFGSYLALSGLPADGSGSAGVILYDLDAQQQVWLSPVNGIDAASFLTMGSGGQLLAATDGMLTSLDVSSGNVHWSSPFAGIPNGICVSGANAYVTTSLGVLKSFDRGTGQPGWAWPADGKQMTTALSAPVAYGNVIYLADSDGNLYAIDIASQEQAWFIPLGSPLDGSPFFIEDGYAYLSSKTYSQQTGDTSTIYAVDLTSNGSKVLSYCTDISGQAIGVDNGNCYIVHQNYFNIAALDFVDQFHQFYSDSALMADGVQGDSSNPQPTTPAYRTHVQLLDKNRNPRVNKAVKVWASDTVNVTINGAPYTLDLNTPASVVTDFAGEISLVAEATDISCPTLYLWSDFMGANQAMMIYPDHYVVNRLANVTSEDLSSARGYDNNTILLDPSSASSTANTITNTIGNVATIMQATRRRMSKRRSGGRRVGRHRAKPLGAADAPEYIAFSPVNLVYNADVTQNGNTRGYTPGSVPNFTCTIDPVTGKSMFQPDAPSDALAATTTRSDLNDFLTNVVRGARKVVQIVVRTAESIVHQITDDLGRIYTITVTALEHAMAVVSGFLKTAVGDIRKAVEWLSEVFSWSKIISAKDTIKNTAVNNLNSLITQTNGLTPEFRQQIQTALGNAVKAIQTGMSTLDGVLKNSMKSQQPNNNDPSTIYNSNGKQSYPQSRWASNKVTDNAANTTDASTGVSLAAMPPPPGFLDAIDAISAAVAAQLAGDFQGIGKDLENFITNFGNLIKDPTTFVTNAFANIINLIGDLLIDLINLFAAILDKFLDNFPTLLSGAISIATHSIKIPMIDELWQVISGDPLTMLDVMALVVAIPSSILSNIVSTSQTAQVQATGGQGADLIGIATILNGMIYAVFDGWGDLSNANGNSGVALTSAALTIIGIGLSIPLTSNDPFVYIYWALAVLPLVIATVSYAKTEKGDQDALNSWSKWVPKLNVGYGIVMVGSTVAGAITNPANFLAPNAQTLLANLFTYFPYLGKFFAAGEAFNPGRVAAGVIDGCCDTAAGITNGLIKLGA